MKMVFPSALVAAYLLTFAGYAEAEERSQVSQYGITWNFDKPYPVGQFVTGDWWVLGPVRVVGVTPVAGPSEKDSSPETVKSRYGATSLVDDKRMRNGSMIFRRASGRSGSGFGSHGYDSRSVSYRPDLSVTFPLELSAGDSLVSTISSETYADGKLATPFVLGQEGIFLCSKSMPLALQSAAILTCVKEEPPVDAFRPAYVGVSKAVYQAKNINWDLLPKLKPVPSTPDWRKMERIFERPWLDHISGWTIQNLLPGENQPAYGREFARMSSIAALMVLLDVPREQKEKLLLEYVQLGIDLHGLAEAGRQWFSDGGHWQGRKWPILFASIMLENEGLRTFPKVDLDRPVYSKYRIDASDDGFVPTTLFQEDMDTYYGEGGDGQDVLWQIVFHTGPKFPYEEKARATFGDKEKFIEGYRSNNSAASMGVALAAQLMKAKAVWNHDAFFDYIDRWMDPKEKWSPPKWFKPGCTRSFDLFTEEMWNTYRLAVPAQPDGKDNVKWVWLSGKSGHFVDNPKKAATPVSTR